jgi:hypothetical protein
MKSYEQEGARGSRMTDCRSRLFGVRAVFRVIRVCLARLTF